MRILIATTAHAPTDVRVGVRIANSLVQAGFQVDWLGPRVGADEALQPRSGIRYVWLPEIKGRRDRLLSPNRLARALRGLDGQYQWSYCCDPDAYAVVRRYATSIRSHLWYDIHEEFEGGGLDRWLGHIGAAPVRGILRRMISLQVARAELVTVASPPLAATYASDPHLPLVLLNAAESDFAPSRANPQRDTAKVTRIMVGKLGPNRGIELVSSASRVLSDAGARIEFITFGSQADLQSYEVRSESSSGSALSATARLVAFEPVPHAEIAPLLTSCTAAVVGYTGRLAAASLPNRFFESMAAGIPVICPIESPEMTKIIDAWECGVTYSNDDPRTLAKAVAAIVADPNAASRLGSNGRRAFDAAFSWRSQFEPVLRRLTDDRPRSS